jgi:immune inhibitor A
VSTDGGSTWTAVPWTVNGKPIGTHGAVPALTGASGGWVNLRYRFSRYAGQAIQFRFRYGTDGSVVPPGFAATRSG